MVIPTYLADIWSVTDFRDAELGRYAAPQIRNDTRQGVQILAGLSLSVNALALLLVAIVDVASLPVYSHIALAALSLHVLVSARFVDDIRALQGLAMVLIIVTALAVILLAHRSGDLSIGMMAAIVMLFISIPLIPWALRETTVVVGCTIILLTSSLVSVPGRFNLEAFWLLQLLVLGSLVVIALLVARNTAIRKRDIRARLELDKARKAMDLLSQKDHLTGAWNRRYLEKQFPKIANECRDNGETLHVAVLDIDDFKGINDHYGHQLADVVLSCLGKIFIRRLGDAGSLVRLGGDEFMVLYSGEDLELLIEQIVADLHEEPSIRAIANERDISFSAGFASAGPNETANPETLYMQADSALYSMKTKRQPVRRETDTHDLLMRTGSWKL